MVRWTAPDDGVFSIAATFTGLDFIGPTTTDVHVLYDGKSVFDGLVEGFGSVSAASFQGSLAVARGDTIDFTVGVGPDGTYDFDNTGLAAAIAPVPEPSTLLLLAVGTLGLMGWACWRSKQIA
jgi:hypothetical protein